MNCNVFPTANMACEAVVQKILNQANAEAAIERAFKIALPTGNTMIPFYAAFLRALDKVDLSHWEFYPVDEYMHENLGIRPDDPRSFHQFLNLHFYNHLMSKKFNRLTWHQHEGEIRTKLLENSLDCVLLGVGLNGHLAFNEPGSLSSDGIRQVQLTDQTILRNFGQNANPPAPTKAITLGMKEILNSKTIHVLAFGEAKSKIVLRSIKGNKDSEVPASLLQAHPNTTWWLDLACANAAKIAPST